MSTEFYLGKRVERGCRSHFGTGLLVVIVMIMMPMMALADEWTDPSTGIVWTYTVSEGKARIGAGAYGVSAIPVGTSGAITIPSVLGGMPVTEIGGSAFFNCNKLTSVTIPKGVLSIGGCAFYGCSGLMQVGIPSGVTSMGGSVFYGCSGLTSLTIPNGVTSVGDSAFSDCSGLTSIMIPSSVSKIGDYAFYNCKKLKSVTIPSAVKRIGNYTFYQCYNLTSITIPHGVTSIGLYAFYYCYRLISITIPEGVTEIGNYAFSDCYGLTSITIPSSVLNVGYAAFYNCSGLTSMTLPFVGACRGNPGTVGSLFGYVFGSSLGMGMKNTIQYYSKYSYQEYGIPVSLKSVVITDETELGFGAFYNCTGLTSITILEGVTNIGDYAFAGCSWLTFVSIPSSVMGIGQKAFDGCRGLTTVYVSIWDAKRVSELYPFGSSVAIEEPNMDDFKISYGTLTKYTGAGGAVAIPSCVTAVGREAFRNCETLTNIMLPSGVTDIGDAAFYDCYGLTNVLIQEGVTNIGQCAFWGCKKLMSIRIPDSVRTIGWVAFWGCQSLRSISVDPESQHFCSEEGVLYDRAKKELICCPGGVVTNEVEVAVSVGKISYYGFYECANLERIVLPPGLKNIEGATFKGCYRLKDIEIPNGVTNIEWEAFRECTSLKTVLIPEGVVNIGEEAFFECLNLMSVRIPSSVTSIGRGAFSYCNSLDVVYVDNGDSDRVKGLFLWPSNVKFIEVGSPFIEGDKGATVTGDPVSGFIIKPSGGKTAVEVTIPQGVDAAKVTVEVSTKVASVKPNGAKVKIVSGGADITEFLSVPAADGNGIVDLTKVTVKEEIVKETMDVEKGAKIELNAANPSLTTPNTRVGLFYQLREGTTPEGMANGDSTIGDGKPWSPEIKVKGGNSAFYSIGVGKGE